jgi:hypothetical protein
MPEAVSWHVTEGKRRKFFVRLRASKSGKINSEFVG